MKISLYSRTRVMSSLGQLVFLRPSNNIDFINRSHFIWWRGSVDVAHGQPAEKCDGGGGNFAMMDHNDGHNDNDVGMLRDTLGEGWSNYCHSLSVWWFISWLWWWQISGLEHANNQMGRADGHGLENKADVQTNFLLTLVVSPLVQVAWCLWRHSNPPPPPPFL